jgi:hypothetical protein
MTKVLSIPKPLPSSVLKSLDEDGALPLDPTEMIPNENKIVCGLNDIPKLLVGHEDGAEPQLHYVGAVLGIFMMLLILFVIGEYIWTR